MLNALKHFLFALFFGVIIGQLIYLGCAVREIAKSKDNAASSICQYKFQIPENATDIVLWWNTIKTDAYGRTYPSPALMDFGSSKECINNVSVPFGCPFVTITGKNEAHIIPSDEVHVMYKIPVEPDGKTDDNPPDLTRGD